MKFYHYGLCLKAYYAQESVASVYSHLLVIGSSWYESMCWLSCPVVYIRVVVCKMQGSLCNAPTLLPAVGRMLSVSHRPPENPATACPYAHSRATPARRNHYANHMPYVHFSSSRVPACSFKTLTYVTSCAGYITGMLKLFNDYANLFQTGAG